MLDCKETAEKLYRYLDRQLSEEEALEVRQHLSKCSNCEDYFLFEEGVLRRVHQVCREVETPVGLKDRVRQMCSGQHCDE